MKKLLYILLLFPTLIMAQTATLTDSDIKAFYTAEGWGKDATGGRADNVYRVTNLNNSGSGSFRQAIADAQSNGGGIITFTVGGTVEISSQVTYTGDNLTIAGETAPGDGIAIHGETTSFQGENIIVRHIRSRPGDGASTDHDGFRIIDQGITAGTYENYIFDHVSVSWADDENFAVETGKSGTRHVNKLTLQNSIISESFGGYNMILWGQNINQVSVLNNLFANSSQRNIRASVTPNVSWEQINNWVYNFTAAVNPTVQQEIDLIGNVFEYGPNTDGDCDGSSDPCYQVLRIETCSGGTGGNCPPDGITDPTGTLWYETDNTLNGGSINVAGAGFSASSYESGSRINSSGYTPRSNSTVKTYIANNAGARKGLSGLDALDAEMLSDAQGGSSGGWVTAESQTSGLPSLSSGTPYTDTDSDGLSDAFETANGGSISPSTRPATCVVSGGTIDQTGVTSYSSQGYTYMDFFLGDLAGDWDSLEFSGGSGDIPVITITGANPYNLTTDDTYSEPGATASDTEDGDITGDIVVGGDTVDDDTPGTYYVTYDVTDSDDNDATQEVREVNVSAPASLGIVIRRGSNKIRGASGSMKVITN